MSPQLQKKSHNSFLKAIENTIAEFNMVLPRETLIIGVSGGPDSIALLNIIYHNFAKQFGLKIHVAHLHHGLRGKESDSDAVFVNKVSSQLGLPCTVLKIDIAALAKRKKMTIEEAGRYARYDFFNKLADKIGATKILVAHNSDDNVETFLMRIIRGSGPKGLEGIPPVNGRIARPLIRVSKKQILDYCKVNSISYVIDSSNSETKYFRNFVRRKVLPLLETVNPKAGEAVLNTMKLITSQQDFIRSEVLKYSNTLLKTAGQAVEIDLDKTKILHPAILGELVREAIRRIKGDLQNVSSVNIEAVLNMKSGLLHLLERLRGQKNKQLLVFFSHIKPHKQ